MKPDFNKENGLLPAIIQDATTNEVLMLGYMNEESYQKTIDERKVCFFSRSKKRLWTKGESSGNFLDVKSITVDCDNDTILIKADPTGPVCHSGSETCFGERSEKGFLYALQQIINERIDNSVNESYTYKIFSQGINKAAQKVGEEAVELVIESIAENRPRFIYEAADLVYHLLILLRQMGLKFEDVESELKSRHR